jgi:hypothetical protein
MLGRGRYRRKINIPHYSIFGFVLAYSSTFRIEQGYTLNSWIVTWNRIVFRNLHAFGKFNQNFCRRSWKRKALKLS